MTEIAKMTATFTLFLLFCSCRADYNTTELSSGLLFEPITEIELITDHWKFITHIDLTSFYDELDYVTQIINKTQEKCHTTEILAHHDNRDSFCEGLTAQLVDDLNEIKEANKYFLHVNRQRRKRGLMNIGGDTLKFLFGTMDANDAEKYELDRNEQKIQTNLNAQKTFMESVITKLNETDIIVNQHTSILNNLEDELSIFKTILRDENFQFQANNIFLQLTSYTSIITNKIRRDQARLFDIIFSAKRGIIHNS